MLTAGLLTVPSLTPALAAPQDAVVQRCSSPTGGSVDPKLDPPVTITVCITEDGRRTTVTTTAHNGSRSQRYRVTVDDNLYWRDSGGDHFKTLKTCNGMELKPSKSATCSAFVEGATYPYPRWGHGLIRFPGTEYLSWAAGSPMINKG